MAGILINAPRLPGASAYLDHDTAAAHHLAGFALTVDLTKADPLAELLVIVNLEESGGWGSFRGVATGCDTHQHPWGLGSISRH